METSLLSYTCIDGIPTMTDSEVAGLYDRMEEDGMVDAVFSDGTVQNPDDFLRSMKFGRGVLFAVRVDGEVSGIVWLTDLEVKRASIHYCFFSNIWKKNLVEVGRECIRQVFRLTGFDLLLGITPETNRAAMIWNRKMRFKTAGKVPGFVWIDSIQKSVSATIYYIERACYG